MTGSTLTALAANPETGLISIRILDAGQLSIRSRFERAPVLLNNIYH